MSVLMSQTCTKCGGSFDSESIAGDLRLNLHGRKHCLECRPYKPHNRTAPPTPRPVREKMCASCGKAFRAKVPIDGKIRSLYRRRFCFDCSPFGIHNSSKVPPGTLSADDLREHRRRRRNAKTYRYQKKRRRELKELLVQAHGGRCEDCGYSISRVALDFHHRDASTKEFALSHFGGQRDVLVGEAAKCDLLCANCHRLRHAAEDVNAKGGAVVEFRRRQKTRAVAFMGGVCEGCGRAGAQAIFEFHHRDATEKEFGITQDGIPRRWEKILAELAKCVMLCANCHREVHAGIRSIGLALPEHATSADTHVA